MQCLRVNHFRKVKNAIKDPQLALPGLAEKRVLLIEKDNKNYLGSLNAVPIKTNLL